MFAASMSYLIVFFVCRPSLARNLRCIALHGASMLVAMFVQLGQCGSVCGVRSRTLLTEEHAGAPPAV